MGDYFNTSEILDLRDLAESARQYLATWEDMDNDPDDRDEAKEALEALGKFMDDLGYAHVTKYAEVVEALESYANNEPTAIRSDYFEEYAEELAEDVGAISREAQWPLNHIDWSAAADALKVDYNEAELEGESYFIRAY